MLCISQCDVHLYAGAAPVWRIVEIGCLLARRLYEGNDVWLGHDANRNLAEVLNVIADRFARQCCEILRMTLSETMVLKRSSTP